MTEMRTVAFVPIRLNSKRVAGKNLKLLGGKPLMCYILESLTKVKSIHEVYVYCSNEGIIPYLPKGVRFLKRPKELDRDNTLGEEIYDAFIKEVPADVYILAHTTSPFLKSKTIEHALHEIEKNHYDSAFSAERIQTFAWYQGKPLNYELKKIPRTQTIDPIYVETSGFYMFRREVWLDLHQRIGQNPYIAEINTIEGVDIDYPDDFAFAERIIETLL